MKIPLYAYPQEFHYRFDHACGGIAVTAHDAVAQRTVVYAEAYGHTAVVAEFEKGNEACTDFFYFGGVFAVGVGQGTERTSGVNEVAWIDAYFLDFLGGGEGGVGIEMYVGHERSVDAAFAKFTAYFTEIAGMAHALSCQTDYVCSGRSYAFALGHGGFGVERGCICHRLQTHRGVGSDGRIAYANAVRVSSGVIIAAHRFSMNLYSSI